MRKALARVRRGPRAAQWWVVLGFLGFRGPLTTLRHIAPLCPQVRHQVVDTFREPKRSNAFNGDHDNEDSNPDQLRSLGTLPGHGSGLRRSGAPVMIDLDKLQFRFIVINRMTPVLRRVRRRLAWFLFKRRVRFWLRRVRQYATNPAEPTMKTDELVRAYRRRFPKHVALVNDLRYRNRPSSANLSPGEPDWMPAMPALRCPKCRTMLAEDPQDSRAVLCVNCGYADAHFAVPQ